MKCSRSQWETVGFLPAESKSPENPNCDLLSITQTLGDLFRQKDPLFKMFFCFETYDAQLHVLENSQLRHLADFTTWGCFSKRIVRLWAM